MMGKKKKKAHRAKTKITYHGRSGKPIIHYTKKGRAYIMVRKKGGGTKRLYLNTKLATRAVEGISKLRKEA